MPHTPATLKTPKSSTKSSKPSKGKKPKQWVWHLLSEFGNEFFLLSRPSPNLSEEEVDSEDENEEVSPSPLSKKSVKFSAFVSSLNYFTFLGQKPVKIFLMQLCKHLQFLSQLFWPKTSSSKAKAEKTKKVVNIQDKEDIEVEEK